MNTTTIPMLCLRHLQTPKAHGSRNAVRKVHTAPRKVTGLRPVSIPLPRRLTTTHKSTLEIVQVLLGHSPRETSNSEGAFDWRLSIPNHSFCLCQAQVSHASFSSTLLLQRSSCRRTADSKLQLHFHVQRRLQPLAIPPNS